MDEKASIEKAIDAHLTWIRRLRSAIRTGASEFTPELVRTDDRCELGRWLQSGFPQRRQGSPLHQEILALHAAFHLQAAEILALALSGKPDEAEQAMAQKTDFAKKSLALIAKLRLLEEQR